MCLQVPLRVLSVGKNFVATEGNRKLIFKGGETLKPGDYVLPYGNMVVSVVDRETARNARRLFKDSP